jgi:hypothetical protein
MSESNNPRIVFSERLATGIVVHFEDHVSVYFPAQFLYEQPLAQPDIDFSEDDEEGGDALHSGAEELRHVPRSIEATTHQNKNQKMLLTANRVTAKPMAIPTLVLPFMKS